MALRLALRRPISDLLMPFQRKGFEKCTRCLTRLAVYPELAEFVFTLQINRRVIFGSRTTDQQIAKSGSFEWFGFVGNLARDQSAFTHVADTGPARPADRHIAGFREFQEARKFRIPRNGEAAPREGDLGAVSRGTFRRMRRCSG